MAGVKGMFERGNRSPLYVQSVRNRIRAGGIVHRLEQHVLGAISMSATQVSAALGLLRKVVPDLSNVEMTGPGGGPLQHEDVSDLEVARRYAFLLSQAAIKKASDKAKDPA